MPAVGTTCESLTSEEVSYMEAAENADPSAPRATAPQDRRDAQFALRGGKARTRAPVRMTSFLEAAVPRCASGVRKATAKIAKAVSLRYI
jgi:hypothetical protein